MKIILFPVQLFHPILLKKQTEAVKTHTLLDVEVFTRYIVPELGINRRYIGEEPLCAVTRTYNDTLKEMLPRCGVKVIEVPRVIIGEGVTSASRVRKLIKEHKLQEVKSLVPGTTYTFLLSREAAPIINRIYNYG